MCFILFNFAVSLWVCYNAEGQPVTTRTVWRCVLLQSSEVEGRAGPDHVNCSCDVFCIILCMSVFSHVPVIECRALDLKVWPFFYIFFPTAQSLLVECSIVSNAIFQFYVCGEIYLSKAMLQIQSKSVDSSKTAQSATKHAILTPCQSQNFGFSVIYITQIPQHFVSKKQQTFYTW